MGGWVGVVGGRVGRDGVVKNSRNFPGNFFRFSGSSQEISRNFPLNILQQFGILSNFAEYF